MLQMLLVASGPTARQHAPDKPSGGISRGRGGGGSPRKAAARMGEVRRLTFFLSLDVLQLARAREQHLQH